MASHEEQDRAYAAQQVILIVVSIVNMFFSALTLFLIYDMKIKHTIYIKIIIALTGFQFIYDSSFLFFLKTNLGESSITQLAAAGLWIGIFFGIMGTILSNLLTSLVFYVVYSKKSPSSYR